MLYLLLAVALCLLVPWLPVLMYRSLPRRPPPPLSEGELRRLADQLRQEPPAEVVEVVPAEETSTNNDITRRPARARAAPRASNEASGSEGLPQPKPVGGHVEPLDLKQA
jgi:hypothetical protein